MASASTATAASCTAVPPLLLLPPCRPASASSTARRLSGSDSSASRPSARSAAACVGRGWQGGLMRDRLQRCVCCMQGLSKATAHLHRGRRARPAVAARPCQLLQKRQVAGGRRIARLQ